jgi:hypothetical protein
VTKTGARFTVNMVSAISAKGDIHFDLFEGRMNTGTFIEFLKKLLHDIPGNISSLWTELVTIIPRRPSLVVFVSASFPYYPKYVSATDCSLEVAEMLTKIDTFQLVGFPKLLPRFVINCTKFPISRSIDDVSRAPL